MARKEVPAFRLVAEPLTPEAVALQPEPFANPEVGTRHRLGGEPALLHDVGYPVCSECEDEMSFYGQLDSLNNLEFDLADAGLLFVFVCFDCFTSDCFIQSG